MNKPYKKKYHQVDGITHISNPITLHNPYPGLNSSPNRATRRTNTKYEDLAGARIKRLGNNRTNGFIAKQFIKANTIWNKVTVEWVDTIKKTIGHKKVIN